MSNDLIYANESEFFLGNPPSKIVDLVSSIFHTSAGSSKQSINPIQSHTMPSKSMQWIRLDRHRQQSLVATNVKTIS